MLQFSKSAESEERPKIAAALPTGRGGAYNPLPDGPENENAGRTAGPGQGCDARCSDSRLSQVTTTRKRSDWQIFPKLMPASGGIEFVTQGSTGELRLQVEKRASSLFPAQVRMCKA